MSNYHGFLSTSLFARHLFFVREFAAGDQERQAEDKAATGRVLQRLDLTDHLGKQWNLKELEAKR